MYRRIAVLLIGSFALLNSAPVMAQHMSPRAINQIDVLDTQLKKAFDVVYAPNEEVRIQAKHVISLLPEDFLNSYWKLLQDLNAQKDYKPAQIIHSMVQFAPVYNQHYRQNP